MIELSIVSGTYNRLPHMQKMVESARQSIGVGVPYEIVLVDGGSTDGTIDWCKKQHDIVLIEQGELLGAIKAFNAGLYAAQGRYCIVGNDDVLYLDQTLLKALAFMDDNPDVGVGCFYQDRDHPGRWDLSYMPAILNGEQVRHVYGQVCIVPRWLGDEVGWWGDAPGMYTYGGDNNLSSFILERGYKVSGIQCACISDMKIVDGLRQINNEIRIAEARERGHPDSNAWGKYWTHPNGTCGPIIKEEPSISNPLEHRMRFLYLPIYEHSHGVQLKQKRGLREALAKYGMVYEYDWVRVLAERGGSYMINYMMDIMDAWQPDVLLTQIHSPDPQAFNYSSIDRVRGEFPNVTWVNWNGDYHPEDLLSRHNIEMATRFDIQCVVTTRVRKEYAQAGVNWMYWQIGYEDTDAEPTTTTPVHDVVFLANGYSRERIQLGRVLRSLPASVGIYGAWGADVNPNGFNLYDFDTGQRIYRAAKISVGDNQWGDTATGFVSNRLFQAMAAGGAMYMQQRVPELDTLLGIEDGKHCVVWNDLGDLKDKIVYWLDSKRDKGRKRIAAAGAEYVRENHSFDVRVAELMDVI